MSRVDKKVAEFLNDLKRFISEDLQKLPEVENEGYKYRRWQGQYKSDGKKYSLRFTQNLDNISQCWLSLCIGPFDDEHSFNVSLDFNQRILKYKLGDKLKIDRSLEVIRKDFDLLFERIKIPSE